jgi:hypothetical protein
MCTTEWWLVLVIGHASEYGAHACPAFSAQGVQVPRCHIGHMPCQLQLSRSAQAIWQLARAFSHLSVATRQTMHSLTCLNRVQSHGAKTFDAVLPVLHRHAAVVDAPCTNRRGGAVPHKLWQKDEMWRTPSASQSRH